MDAVGEAHGLAVAHISFADVLNARFAVPAAVDGDEGRVAVAALKKTGVAMSGRGRGHSFGRSFGEKILRCQPVFS